MILEKSFVHEIHEIGLAGISLRSESSQKTRNWVSRDDALYASTRKVRQKLNSCRDFDLHLAGELLSINKIFIYLVSFVLFVDKKRFLG
ncbi:MAG: hypothetical protein Q7T38_03550 [Gallionella sp.]|nr:hypothetical protein [Gallionella sp.]